jgi:hypothetical protein
VKAANKVLVQRTCCIQTSVGGLFRSDRPSSLRRRLPRFGVLRACPGARAGVVGATNRL